MWLLEHGDEAFEGKKLWLRPGKRYLFGRTSTEAGQICIPDKTISRKHLTIEVAQVPKGQGADPRSRSTVTLEDLKTKLGTLVNAKSIKGEQFTLVEDDNTIKLGECKSLFRIKWHPVVIGCPFTKAELEQGALTTFQEAFEPIDIKYTTDPRLIGATYVVSKRRNTSRVLQALVNGQVVVNQAFTDAIVQAAALELDENGVHTSKLEQDFEGSWPDATKYLPPRTECPGGDQPDKAFAPDNRRKDIFDGYTFIFYERKRFEDLLSVITSGKGKALLREAVLGETDINDFIRYVKGIAGEKGLGEFEDGSEGRGVVVVRFVPPGEGQHTAWYLNFYNQVALRLDHRPIEPRDLLPAILDIEPAQLRRPLEVEPTPRESAVQDHQTLPAATAAGQPMDIDEPHDDSVVEESPPPPPPPPRGRRQRAAAKSRFRGFNVGSDSEDQDEPAVTQNPNAPAQESQGMFMTQPEDNRGQTHQTQQPAVASQRKRHAPERDIMEEVAPTAARVKRMRLEEGVNLLPAIEPSPPPADEDVVPKSPPRRGKAKAQTTTKATKGRRSKKTAEESGDELLDQYIEAGRQEDAKRQAEEELVRRELNEGEVDFQEIRKATAVQTIAVRRPAQKAQDRNTEEDRWDPQWNGLKNFKQFRKQGQVDGRPQNKVIVSLEPVRPKEYGLSDDYWLHNLQKGKKGSNAQSQNVTQTQGRSQVKSTASQRGGATQAIAVDSDSEENFENAMNLDSAEPSRSRKGKAAEKAGSQQRQAIRAKRVAVETSVPGKPAKRPRMTRATRATQGDSEEDEDSEDGGLSFRFGKRK